MRPGRPRPPRRRLPAGLLRPTFAWVDLDCLLGNLAEIRRVVGSGPDVLAVVKADAYGHGALPVARALVEAGVRSFGVATVEEGLELREGGIPGDILVLGGVPLRGAAAAVAADLAAAVFDLAGARALDAAAARLKSRVSVHIKVDTGMARLGVPWRELMPLARGLARLSRLDARGIFTVLAEGDEPRSVATQVQRLRDARDTCSAAGISGLLLHASNSSSLGASPTSRLDFVRPGLALYGLAAQSSLRLRPVLSLETEVIALRRLARGETVGYSGTYVCTRPSRIATLPIGYADGLPRAASNRGSVLIGGRRAPIVGNVSMDLTTIDVTEVGRVRCGDRVVVLGEDGDEAVGALELARTCATIPWEIVARLGQRVPRLYRLGRRTISTSKDLGRSLRGTR